jgi:CBS domain containing-hemolysin-like protein
MNWSALVWMVLLLLANGFFVAAEFAYITARRNVLEQSPTRSSQVAVGLNRNLSLSLAAAQLGITMASLLLGAVAEPAVASILERLLGFVPISENAIHAISLIIALLIVVFLHMVVGEMAPKNIAISSPERSAIVLALPFRGFILAFRPLGDLDASEVMVPRPDVDAAPVSATVAQIQELMRVTGHSRIPLYGEDIDEIVGFVHVKDMMTVDDEGRDRPLDPSLVRDPLLVPESAPLRAILAEMRKSRSHLGIVVDEHGSTAGIITLEDIAEELVGEISDEHDSEQQRVSIDASGRILAAGTVRPDELSRHGIRLPGGDYETIGGLIMNRLGRLPRRGDVIEDDGWRMRVVKTDGRRVGEVEVTPLDQGPSAG